MKEIAARKKASRLSRLAFSICFLFVVKSQ